MIETTRLSLRAELTALDRMIAACPEGSVIDRASLEARRSKVTAQLADHDRRMREAAEIAAPDYAPGGELSENPGELTEPCACAAGPWQTGEPPASRATVLIMACRMHEGMRDKVISELHKSIRLIDQATVSMLRGHPHGVANLLHTIDKDYALNIYKGLEKAFLAIAQRPGDPLAGLARKAIENVFDIRDDCDIQNMMKEPTP